MGWKVNDKWGNCSLSQNGWTYAEVVDGWRGPPFEFFGPNNETWMFYKYADIYGDDEDSPISMVLEDSSQQPQPEIFNCSRNLNCDLPTHCCSQAKDPW